MNKIKSYLKNLFEIMSKNEMRILPGNLAFFLTLSIMPILTLIGVICSTFSLSTVEVTEMLSDVLPDGIISILQPFFSAGSSDTSHLIILLILGFIVASNGAHAIILASNQFYKIKDSNYLARKIKAFFLTVILLLMFVFVLVVLAFGNTILKFVLSFDIFSSIATDIYSIFILFKWPTAFLVIYCLIKLLYTMAPDKKVSSKYVTTGAMFTTLGLLIGTAIYSLYANNLANYERFYGNLSNIAMLMLWIYLISYIFVLGIAINTSYYGLDEEKRSIE